MTGQQAVSNDQLRRYARRREALVCALSAPNLIRGGRIGCAPASPRNLEGRPAPEIIDTARSVIDIAPHAHVGDTRASEVRRRRRVLN